jgi:hypothetical protein
MKTIICAGIMLMLTACGDSAPQTQFVARNKFIAIDVPANLYYCPTVVKFPSTVNMTDIEVARLLVQLQKNNISCANSMTAIQAYLSDAKLALERQTP